jgi:hypothetical protein
MTKAIVGAALAVLALAASANAVEAGTVDISAVTSTSTVTYGPPLPSYADTSPPTTSGSTVISSPSVGGAGGYGSYLADTTYKSSSISFSDNATSMGASSYVTATTTLTVTIMNNTGSTVSGLSLASAITPAGFGIFVATPNTPDIDKSLADSGETFNNFVPTSPCNYCALATANYNFAISVGATAQSAQTSLASYAQNLILLSTPNGPIIGPLGNGLASGTGAIDTPYDVEYNWGQTNLDPSLPSLGAGDSETITYISSVSSFTNAVLKSGDNSGAELLAYACFGDPIGKGNDPHCSNSFTVGQPSLENGVLSFNIPVVPEPQTWALMLIGAGFVGGALRRRARPHLA